jgi:CheY-like chemotaxis protein
MTVASPTRRLCLLLIDDNPADCMLAEEAFELYSEQVSIKVIQDGQSALDWLHEQAAKQSLPDVVLLDVNMPGMNGFEVLSALRNEAIFRHLPVVMLTTSTRQEDVDQAYELIASSYLVKQPDFRGFLDQIDSLVRFWSQARFRQQPKPMN